MLDWLLEDDGDALLFSPLGSYVDHDHEAIREMIMHPASILGLSDGGAHCGLICDASFPTYLLTHWTRDRTRGELIPIEHVVHKQTQATAVAYGITDRGVLAPGMLADINVIDHDALRLHRPRMVYDLPAGGKRLLQDVEGYRVTIKAGETTFVDGEVTDARPGPHPARHRRRRHPHLIRGTDLERRTPDRTSPVPGDDGRGRAMQAAWVSSCVANPVTNRLRWQPTRGEITHGSC